MEDAAWNALKWGSKKAKRKLEEMWHERGKRKLRAPKTSPIKHQNMRSDVARESGRSTRGPGVTRVKKGKSLSVVKSES